jgi:hypothetical protein
MNIRFGNLAVLKEFVSLALLLNLSLESGFFIQNFSVSTNCMLRSNVSADLL